MVYKLLNIKIEKKQYTSIEDMQIMLDVFAIGERITTEQYQELTLLLNN